MIFEFLVQKMFKISVDHIYFRIGPPSIFTKHFIILTELQKFVYVFSIYEIWKNICIAAKLLNASFMLPFLLTCFKFWQMVVVCV